MSNEIKVGDKVRVREDAPKILRKIIPSKVFDEYSEVIAQDDEMAVIWTEPIHKNLIPLKYIIKVEEEKKEPKFKVGDVVRIKPNADKLHQGYQNGYAWLSERDSYLGRVASVKEIWCDGSLTLNIGGNLIWEPIDLEPYTEPTTPKYKKGDRVKFKNIYELQKVKDKSFRWMLVVFASKEATITAVEDNGFYRVDIDPSVGGINDDMIECKVEPTEQTEAEKKPNVGSIKIPVEVDLTDSYWDAYAAELAKEIVLKTVNSASDRRPMSIAEYATDIAKAVVEGLKRK